MCGKIRIKVHFFKHNSVTANILETMTLSLIYSMKDFLNILNYKLVGLNFLLVILFALLIFFSPVSSVVLFILLSNFFDILGYHIVLIRKGNDYPSKEIVKSYRVIQFLFDLLLLVLIGLLFNWIFSISGWILKLFGVQDVLYYIFLKTSLPENWNWMRWTPLGFYFGVLSKQQIIIQAIIGSVISLLLIILN